MTPDELDALVAVLMIIHQYVRADDSQTREQVRLVEKLVGRLLIEAGEVGVVERVGDYSENEWKLIGRYGFSFMSDDTISPPLLYQLMAAKAFILNDQGPAAMALRRGLVALNNMQPRLTPEFEALISFDD